MIAIAARCRTLLAGLVALATLGLSGTASAAALTTGAGCPQVAVAQPFAPWNDAADYFLAPDGGLERGGQGWALSGGATVVRGNEPFHVVSSSDNRSLLLPAGSSATSAPFCIGVEHRTLRFFARAAAPSSLDVDVLYADAAGAPRQQRIASQPGSGAWAPSDILPMVVNALAAERGNAMTVRLRFTPRRAAWAIDDLHIDPYRGR